LGRLSIKKGLFFWHFLPPPSDTSDIWQNGAKPYPARLSAVRKVSKLASDTQKGSTKNEA